MENAVDAGSAAPVATNEPANPAATPENVAAPAPGTEAAQEVDTQAEKKSFTQEQLNEIIQKEKAKAEAKAERRALKAYRETLEKFAPPQQQPRAGTPTPDTGRPTQSQFENVDDYVEAMADWKLAQRDQQIQQQQQAQQAQTLAAKTENFYSEAQKIPGFDREAFDELPLTRHIAEALIESESPAKLMAHMAANPDEVARIASLSPARQAAEIGKLETKLASAPKPSSAPPPIKPIGTRGSGSPTDLSKASMDDYIAQRSKQGARWAR